MTRKLRKFVLKELFMFEGLQIYLTKHWQVSLPVLLLCEMPILYGVLSSRIAWWCLLVLPCIWPGGFLLLMVVVGSIISLTLRMPRFERNFGAQPKHPVPVEEEAGEANSHGDRMSSV